MANTIAPCAPSTPVFGVVVFDPAGFQLAFPAFATLTTDQCQMAFDNATLLLNNSCGSKVKDANKRSTLLNLLTAHVAALMFGQNGQAPPGIVGRIDKATEGSVSVSAVMDTRDVYGKDWYVQTFWGGMYWTATSIYRRFRYIRAPLTCADFNGGLGSPGQFWPDVAGGPTDGNGDPFGGGCGC